MSAKAEIIINGPKGQSFATVEVEADGVTIMPYAAEAALAAALNHYNELPAYKAVAFGKDNFVINPDWRTQRAGGSEE